MTADVLTPLDLGTILSVWAHPDDETYTSAGVMAAAVANGQRVVCATATAGEHGADDPVAWPPERLAQVRRWEATAAMAVLGVSEHRIAGFPDGGLAGLDDAGRAWIAGLLDEVQPDTILTFGPDGGTGHTDHIAVHRWVTAEWEQRGRTCRLLYTTITAEHMAEFGPLYDEWGVYMTDDRPTGVPERDAALALRLEGVALDQKLAALRAMATQTASIVAAIGTPLYAATIADEPFVTAEYTLDRRSAG